MNDNLSDVQSKISQWNDTAPHPWRRFFARLIDTSINGMLSLLIFNVCFYIVNAKAYANFLTAFSKPGGQILDILVTVFFAVFVNAAFIGFTGSSIGKWLFGIRVLKDGEPIGYILALKRELSIWVTGLGFGLPVVSLFTLWWGYEKLIKDGITAWDEKLKLHVIQRQNGTLQNSLSMVGFILFIAVQLISRVH